jgi:outer membrane protein assembly factor BamB
MPPFDEYAAANDADKDGRFSEREIPPGDMRPRFLQLDADKDGFITRAEWDNMARIFDAARNAILALKPAAAGEARVGLAWSYERGVPYVSSPLHYRGHIYMVKDGGILTLLEASTGKLVKQSRLPGEDGYYSSPVATGGKVFAVSLAGVASVIAEGPGGAVLETRDFHERTAATPAIADGRILIRTEKRLVAFGPRNDGGEASSGGSR